MIVLLAAILLSVSIVLSKEETKIVWKGSILAILFHGLSGWSQVDLNTVSVKAMKGKAQKMSAKLLEDENGAVMLVRTQES